MRACLAAVIVGRLIWLVVVVVHHCWHLPAACCPSAHTHQPASQPVSVVIHKAVDVHTPPPATVPAPQPSCRRGVMHAKAGDLAGAVPCYDQALQLDASNADALVARGAALANRRDWQRASGTYGGSRVGGMGLGMGLGSKQCRCTGGPVGGAGQPPGLTLVPGRRCGARHGGRLGAGGTGCLGLSGCSECAFLLAGELLSSSALALLLSIAAPPLLLSTPFSPATECR